MRNLTLKSIKAHGKALSQMLLEMDLTPTEVQQFWGICASEADKEQICKPIKS